MVAKGVNEKPCGRCGAAKASSRKIAWLLQPSQLPGRAPGTRLFFSWRQSRAL